MNQQLIQQKQKLIKDRQRMLDLLTQNPAGLTFKTLAALMRVTTNCISRHMREMETEGYVTLKRKNHRMETSCQIIDPKRRYELEFIFSKLQSEGLAIPINSYTTLYTARHRDVPLRKITHHIAGSTLEMI